MDTYLTFNDNCPIYYNNHPTQIEQKIDLNEPNKFTTFTKHENFNINITNTFIKNPADNSFDFNNESLKKCEEIKNLKILVEKELNCKISSIGELETEIQNKIVIILNTNLPDNLDSDEIYAINERAHKLFKQKSYSTISSVIVL